MSIGSFFTKKVGPLPVWAYGAIAAGGGYILMSSGGKGKKGQGKGGQSGTDSSDANSATSGGSFTGDLKESINSNQTFGGGGIGFFNGPGMGGGGTFFNLFHHPEGGYFHGGHRYDSHAFQSHGFHGGGHHFGGFPNHDGHHGFSGGNDWDDGGNRGRGNGHNRDHGGRNRNPFRGKSPGRGRGGSGGRSGGGGGGRSGGGNRSKSRNSRGESLGPTGWSANANTTTGRVG